MSKINIRILFVFNFCIGFIFYAPLAIIYFAHVSGSYTLGTSIFGIIMLSAASFEVPTGVLSDTVGRRRTLILGSWTRVAAFVCYAIGASYWFLVIGAVLEGISRAFYSGNNDALLYDTLSDTGDTSKYKEYLGKTNSAEFVGLTLSSVIGSLVATISFSYVMWMAVASQIILLIVSYQLIEPRSHRKNDMGIYTHIREVLALFVSNRKLRLLSIATILDNSLSELAYQFRGAFFISIWPVWALGISSLISNACATVGMYMSGKILNTMKSETALLFRSVADRLINIISLVFPTILSPVLMSSTSFMYGVGVTAENDLRQKEFTHHQRATMGSLISLGRSIGAAGMTLVLGKAADIYGPRIALLQMTILALSVTAVYGAIYRDHRLAIIDGKEYTFPSS
ncbi:MAG: MFS transporter [Candidatus Roizmanbacteria bacterium]